ncbi:hypothetical protein H0H81_002340 [Sphagnurus paluster]|uniref:UBZ4-type domain-containing protein n=1 Tax=Sphagnurus paluster TaxID=117069 RepID=A0A9P7K6C4_9AGAR|nr:hypothetical protein H0H81_002340 [Sphagnurus paluster]
MLIPAHEPKTVSCPICSKEVPSSVINEHLDSSCLKHIDSALQSSSSSCHLDHTSKPVTQQKTKSLSFSPIAPIFSQRHQRTSTNSQVHNIPKTSQKRNITEDHVSRPPAKRSKQANLKAAAPLAEKLRPEIFSDFVGQKHLIGPGSLLMKTFSDDTAGSIIFWGPPGCGKTTLARLIAKQSGSVFNELSATIAGINDVRVVLDEAKNTLGLTGKKTILFLDEVHRFSKSQQDVFLPFVEKGLIQLIGATTENPSFKLTGALISRCRVFVLERLTDEDIKTILINAMKRIDNYTSKQSEGGSEPSSSQNFQCFPVDPIEIHGHSFPHLTSNILSSIVSLATGDARTAISLLDLVIKSPKDIAEGALLTALKRSVSASYDRTGEGHYDMISALHKSVRGSQGSAAMYWLARMLTAGEDPLYIARRMVVCASEDIGLADPHALPLAIAALQACQIIGMPECRINLAHLVAYLSEAPKSTRAYEAYKRAEDAAKLDLTIPDEGDTSDKLWDDEALTLWERENNGGKDWEGRS